MSDAQFEGEVLESLGARLRARRREARLLQRDVARAAGLSPGHLSDLEADRVRASRPLLRRLAAVLDLDAEALLAQADGEGRLGTTPASRGLRSEQPVAARPSARPARPTAPAPAEPWLTAAAAAAVLGYAPASVRDLVRRGRLAPARREPGGGRRPRLFVAAAAVADYRARTQWWRPAHEPRPVPAGYLTVPAFAAAVGLTVPTLYRRIKDGRVRSVKRDHRRLIPVAELERYRAEATDG